MQTLTLTNSHLQEWRDSQVPSEIIEANVLSLESDRVYDWLFTAANLPRRNDRRVVDWVLRRYRHVEEGGWWCAGEDLVELKKQSTYSLIRTLWGQFKPDQPFVQPDGKVVKYEPTPRAETRVFALHNPLHPRFWLDVLTNIHTPIIITEGAKKAGCLLGMGYAAIALPGIFNGYRRETGKLIADLAALCTPGRPIYICFDHDTKKKTIDNVRIAIQQLGRLFRQADCKVFVIVLPGPEKGVDDFIAAKGADAFHTLFCNALPLAKWDTQRFNQLTYTTSQELNQKFLGDIKIPTDTRLVGIKSPKGSGKTEWLIKVVAAAMERGQRVLLLTHRVQLGQAICDRIGLNYVTELWKSGEGALFGYGLCVDSAHAKSQARFNPDDWENALIIVDEAEQVFWHLLNSSTEVSKNRLEILRNLQQVFQYALEGGQMILLDADLTDVSLKFVQKMAEMRVQPHIVLNLYNEPVARTCYLYSQSKPETWWSALNEAVDNGDRAFVVVQSKEARSRWSACNLAKDILKRHPHKKVLVIDANTVSDPTHAAYGCISHLNEILPEYDLVIATPCVETGVSIDIRGHFNSVWGCFWGVSSANSARQALARVRDDVPRHVWATHYGMESIGNGQTSKYGLLMSQAKAVQGTIALLQQKGVNRQDDYTTNDAAVNCWAEMACRINAEVKEYRLAIAQGLVEEGYELVDLVEFFKNPEVIESLDQTREASYADCITEELEASDLSDSQGEKLSSQKEADPQDRAALRKWKRRRRFGGLEVTEELIRKDDDGWFPQVQLHYYLGMGKDFVQERDLSAIATERSEGQIWFPSFLRGQIGVKTWLLNVLGIQQFLNGDSQFKNSDPAMQTFIELAQKNSWFIKSILNITVGEDDSPIRFANKLLKRLGMKLIRRGSVGGRGQQEKVYELEPLEDSRFEVFSLWYERDLLKRNEAAVSPVLKDLYLEDGAYSHGQAA